MSILDKLISFIPVLDTEGLGTWNTDVTGTDIVSMRAPNVEYWDVVHRFADTVLDIADSHGELLEGNDESAELLNKLVRLVRYEENCPGILLGAFESGIVLDWLKKLRMVVRDTDAESSGS